MKSKKIYASSSIRFRRWSRAGYAVFCSLACTVTIGSLDVSISDKSLQKAVGISKCSVLSFANDTESPDKPCELSELEVALNQIQETSLLKNSFESAAACFQVSNNYFINQNG